MSQLIEIEIGGGLRLVAETGSDPDYDREICIGVVDENDTWLQDLAIVRNAYMYEDTPDGNWAVKWYEGLFEVCVFADEHNEDYTNKYRIPFWANPE